MTIDPQRARDLFLKVARLAPAQREQILRDECGEDEELRRRVEALLLVNDNPESFLDGPQTEFPATQKSKPPLEATLDSEAAFENVATSDIQLNIRPGVTINDRFVLQKKIGEGGMGEVWVAKQSAPVKRTVAIKLIKPGMDSRAVITRFEQERQALALMDHPNIAKVLDAGVTPSGQPFFVMELINGLPLTEYCDQSKLAPRDRLTLFVPICNAVQHAHQKGIVHRDLKPANILVTMVDGQPVPKVIDFGVAKATGGKLTDATLSTEFGAVVGTLEYMSPEQAGYSGVDIDTRSDIYSLGVILYELLTGLRPFDSSRLKRAALGEMIRIIQEETPSKPSTRLSTNDALPSLAASRQTEPRKLMAILRGELDWIVLKCLEKSRDRRYETANGLARDIERFLHDEPVEARPPSTTYRLGKFLRRNTALVTAFAAVLLALVVGVFGTTVGLLRAQRAETIANEKADEANDARSATEKVNLALQESITREAARFELARKAIGVFHGEVSQDLLLKESKFQGLRTRLLENAAEFYDELETLLKSQSDRKAQTALGQAYFDLGELTTKIGDQSRALEVHNKGLVVARQIAAEGSNAPELQRDVMRRLYFVGQLHLALGNLAESETAYREGIKIGESLESRSAQLDELGVGLGSLMINMGNLLSSSGKVDEALDWYERAKKVIATAVDETPESIHSQSALAMVQNNIGGLLVDQGKTQEALETYQNTLDIRKKLVEKDPGNAKLKQDLAMSYQNIVYVHTKTGSAEDQKKNAAVALAIRRSLVDENPAITEFKTQLVSCYDDFGYAYLAQGALNEAFESYSNAISIQEGVVAENPEVVQYRAKLAVLHNNLGASLRNDMTAALIEFKKAAEVQEEIVRRFPSLVKHRSDLAQSYQNVGLAARFGGNNDEALVQYRKAIDLLEQLRIEDPKRTDYSLAVTKNLQNIAIVMNAKKDYDAAARELEKAIEIQEKLVSTTPGDGNFSRELGRSLTTLANNYYDAEKFDEARPYFQRARDIHQQLVKDFPDIYDYQNGLAFCLSGLGRTENRSGNIADAVSSLKSAIETRRSMSSLSPNAKYDMASNLALLVSLAANDAAGISEKETEELTAESLQYLKQAIATGKYVASEVKTDTNFEALLENEDFKQLLD
jgi:eukaryotic-like serine/threonine-protein kinase